MGLRATMQGITYAQSHIAAATAKSHNVTSIHTDVLLQASELTGSLQLLVSTMQNGDGNITVINSLISQLS
jgi:hypothetical protein